MRANANHITCAKVLIFVTLFAWSATIVATDESNANDPRLRSFEAENTEGRRSNPAAEERGPPLENAVSEVEGLVRSMNKLSLEHTNTLGIDSARLSIGTSNNNFLKSEHFFGWADSVYGAFENTAEGKEMALPAMLTILGKHLRDDDLAGDILAATEIDGRTKEIATDLLNVLFEKSVPHDWVPNSWPPTIVPSALRFIR